MTPNIQMEIAIRKSELKKVSLPEQFKRLKEQEMSVYLHTESTVGAIGRIAKCDSTLNDVELAYYEAQDLVHQAVSLTAMLGEFYDELMRQKKEREKNG